MTQEEKELLLQDLCARLPYGVKVEVTNTQGYHHENVAKKGEKTIDTLKGFDSSHNCFTVYHNNPLDWDWTCSEIDIEDIKPYLIPLSSMTEEQKEELLYKYIHNDIYFDDFTDYFLAGELWHDICVSMFDLPDLINWLNKNHFDYRGLIPMGLAIDATNLNIY